MGWGPVGSGGRDDESKCGNIGLAFALAAHLTVMPVATTGVGPQLPADKMPPPVSSSSSPPLSAVALEHLGWEELSRHAKHLENTLDSRLLALGRLTSAVLRRHRYDTVIVASRGGDVLRQAEELARSVEEELGRLGAIIEALAARCGEAGGTTLHIMQRHRDIHAEYLKEYRKTRVRAFCRGPGPHLIAGRSI